MKVLVILDGFDELLLPKYRDVAIQEIRTLTSKLQQSTVVVTSRTGDFPYHIEQAKQFEIRPLTDEQIVQFANKWLENDIQAKAFLQEIQNSPFSDTAIKPLTLAHLCAIFERKGTIPPKPKSVYRMIIDLLLEQWDEQRSIKRHSKYADFEIDRKREFLSNLAYELTTTHRSTTFSQDQMHVVYNKIYANFDLHKNEARKVIDELESHTGLFIHAGRDTYEFVHKSLQEFLAAEYIVKLPRVPHQQQVIQNIPNELAIAVAISSSPSEYFTELVPRKLNLLAFSCHVP